METLTPGASGFSLLGGCDGGMEEDGAEVACGEGIQGAQASFEFGRGYAALTEEAANGLADRAVREANAT